MSDNTVIGFVASDGVVCVPCGKDERGWQPVTADGYPDGFTCDVCEIVIGADNYTEGDE